MNANPAWLAAGWTMIHLGWVGLAIALVAAIGRRLLKTASPEARYGLAVAALLGLAVSPVVVFARVYEPGDAATVATAPKSVAISASTPNDSRPLPSMPVPRLLPRRDQTARAPSLWTLDRLAGQLPWAWLVGSMASMASLATGLIGVHRLSRSSVAVEGDFDRRCQALARAIGVAGRVGVAACDRLVSPVLIGILRPMILLPPSAFDVWTWEQVEMALLHELAHLKRWDNHVNILQRVVESVLFFHPAAWWLSGWVRLERELCCDRLVVDRLGRPLAYASMLASLAGLEPRPATPMGMANREVMTRIRWILDPKDRAMTMTLPEGLGLIAATVIGLGLAIGTHAKPPENPTEPVKLALRKAIDEAADAKDDGKRHPMRSSALVDIAGMQLNLGDREGALASIDKATKAADRPLNRRGEEMDRITELAQIAQVRREAGDLDGARAMLDRVVAAIEAMKPPRLRDRLAWAAGFVKALVTEDEEVVSYFEDPNQTFGGFRAGMMAAMAEERIKLGDLEAGRTLVRRAVVLIRAESGQVALMYLGTMPPILARAGDMAGAREILEEFRKAAMEKTNPEERNKALCYLAKSFAEIGDVGPALDLARSLEEPKFRVHGLDLIVDALCEPDRENLGTCLDQGGIKIVVGAVGQKPKDRDLARKVLPDVARAVIETGASVPLKQARTLTTIACLQAMAGDLDGARATALSIPDVKRSAFPGPSTGLYDAIKPATLAIVARIANDPDLFRKALDLARLIEADDQAIVARLVIAREQTAAGRKDDAIACLAELVPIALRQAEPRRSRALSSAATEQAQAGDLAGASTTAEAIRDYPGLEKHQALCRIADGLKKAGDKAGEARALREALRIVRAKPPEHPSMGTALNELGAFGGETFVDPDLEFALPMCEYDRDSSVPRLMVRLGDVDGAIRVARGEKTYRRDNTLKDIAGMLAAQGDVQAALDLARSIDSAEGRLEAVDRIAQELKPTLPFPATMSGVKGN